MPFFVPIKNMAEEKVEEKKIENQNERTAKKAKLLGERSEDEVRIAFGQEAKLGLGTAAKAFAHYAAGANGD